MNETAARIHEWLVGNFPMAKKRQIGMQDSLLQGGIIDSLGTLEVVEFLEAEFGIAVIDEEMIADHFETVHSIARFVHHKTTGNREES